MQNFISKRGNSQNKIKYLIFTIYLFIFILYINSMNANLEKNVGNPINSP